ncbi:MucBP domain-containing protein, partial [Enterococcus faecalis]
MKKSKFLGLIMSFALIWLFMFSNNVQAANQYGYPEALYNGSMSRWEADLSQSSLYEGTQDMQFYNYPYWSQDPSAKNMIYNTISFNPGIGGYNSVNIQYPSDNGSWRSVYLMYVGPVKVEYLEVDTNNVLSPVNYVAGEGGATYNIQSQQISGYQLDHVEGTGESGTFKFLGADYGSAGNPNLSGIVRYFYKKIAVGADVT